LTPGHVYLVEGDPGTGKTTLGIQFLLEGIAHGEPTLYITLAESQEELKAVALSHGFDISKVEIFEVKPPELEQNASDQYTVFHPSEVELVDVMQNILRKLEQTKAGRIVFDSMSEIRMLARDPLRYRRQILSVKQFFVGRKCTVLLLDDRTGDRTDRQLQSICHGAIRLETEARQYGPPPGSGISRTTRHKLFEPFFTTKGTIGTGLGLWLTKDIIDRHHGLIQVRNHRHPRGAVFSIWIPEKPVGTN
jgi:circadian clock protein KaiC